MARWHGGLIAGGGCRKYLPTLALGGASARYNSDYNVTTLQRYNVEWNSTSCSANSYAKMYSVTIAIIRKHHARQLPLAFPCQYEVSSSCGERRKESRVCFSLSKSLKFNVALLVQFPLCYAAGFTAWLRELFAYLLCFRSTSLPLFFSACQPLKKVINNSNITSEFAVCFHAAALDFRISDIQSQETLLHVICSDICYDTDDQADSFSV